MSQTQARTPVTPTFWEKTKNASSTAYSKALKPGFEKAYAYVDKLGAPVNRLSNKVGAEAFWPTTLDIESEKAARIVRSFCKDGFYEHIDEYAAQKAEEDRKDLTANVPRGVQRVVVKIPKEVIQNAKGLAIYTTMRYGWFLGGSGGAGVLVGRHPETGEWSPPSGIHIQNMSFGFLIGVDIYDSVLVINTYEALAAFSKMRTTLGTEVGVVAGPVGIGGTMDTELKKQKPSPIWSYVKSRGLYAGIAIEGNIVIERTDENERFYGEKVGVADLLLGKAGRMPPKDQYRVLMDTLKAAQGDAVDESLLPDGLPPSDFEIAEEQPIFGIPAEDDDDPYGVKALEAEGLHIREAGTHQRPSAEVFEFKPAPSSPIFNSFRKSGDFKRRTGSWRGSIHSMSSMTKVTQDEEESKETEKSHSRNISIGHSPLVIQTSVPKMTDEEIVSTPKSDGNDTHDEISDIDSDVEIETAVPMTAQATRMVNVPKRPPPALPPRNPGRAVPASPPMFTIKLKTHRHLPQHGLALRTSVDNWTADRKGILVDGVWQFQLDPSMFTEGFECKFVIMPNTWMYDPNLHVSKPEANGIVEFTDGDVNFPDIPSELTDGFEAVSLNDSPTLTKTYDDDNRGEDHFHSVPPSPFDDERNGSNGIPGAFH